MTEPYPLNLRIFGMIIMRNNLILSHIALCQNKNLISYFDIVNEIIITQSRKYIWY